MQEKEMDIVEGDLFEAKADVVMHQCNCMCVWGAGVALKMKEVFPEAYEADRVTMPNKWKFGQTSHAEIKRENPMGVKWVYNLYGQVNYGYRMRMTGYPEFERAFAQALWQLDKKYPEHCEIAIPYLIGCGLAGGDPKIITMMIDRQVKKYGDKFHVTAYRLNK